MKARPPRAQLAPNPSIERTSKRLRLFAAAHVERCASAPAFACPPPGGLSRGVPAAVLERQSAVGAARSFFGPSRSMSSPGAARRAAAGSTAGAVCARHQGASRVPSNTTAQFSAVRSAQCSARSLTALLLCSASAQRSFTALRMRACGASNPGSHNTSIERTNNGGQGCAAWRASLAPLFAAHVER
jgi:hypothetical protein